MIFYVGVGFDLNRSVECMEQITIRTSKWFQPLIRSKVLIYKLQVQPKENLTAVSQMPNQGLHHLVYHYFNVEWWKLV